MNFVLFIAFTAIAWLTINAVYSLRREFFAKRNLKIYYGVVLVYKRSKSVEARRVPSKALYASAALFALALVTFYYSMISSILIRAGYLRGIPAQLLVPGVNVTGLDLVFFLVGVAIAATVHELMHAVVAASRGIRVKSMGAAVALVVPLAFTEVDEKDFVEASRRNRVLVLSAGPASNYLLALVAVAVLALITAPSGLAILEVQPNSLAQKHGLEPGDVILEINGEAASSELLSKCMSREGAENVTLRVLSRGEVREVVVYKPEGATRLGVRVVNKPADLLMNAIGQYHSALLILLIAWIYVVNLGLAVINAAPIFISDGGRIFYELFRSKKVGHAINLASLAILILAISPIR